MDKPWTLTQLKESLIAGYSPESLGEFLGGGAYRKAYKIGIFVVKAAGGDSNREEQLALARKAGVRLAPTVRCGTWEIQLFYQRRFGSASGNDRNAFLESFRTHLIEHGLEIPYYYAPRVGADIHLNNVALDRRGRWVAFDW